MGRLKKNLKEMNIANGKLWNHQEIGRAGSIGEKYISLAAEDYEAKIRNMNLFDLQTHAAQVLVPIKENKEVLIKNLLQEFNIRKNS